MQKLVRKFEKQLVRVEEFLCSTLLFAMILVTLWGVFERFVLHIGMGWTDEVARYISIYCVFIGASLGVYKSAHIGVDVIVRILPSSMNKTMSIIAGVLSGIFCGAIAWTGFSFFLRLYATHQVSTALRIPICWVFLAIPIGCFLMMLHYIVRIIWGDEEDSNDADAHKEML